MIKLLTLDCRDVSRVLSGDKEMSLCIILRRQSAAQQLAEPDAEANQQDAQAAETEPAADAEWESPQADLMEVIEKWRDGLAKEYGISQQRLTVITVEADADLGESLELWFVPPGASLPDPFAKDEEEVVEDEAMETEQTFRN